jgi:hypothetical protein
MVSIIQRNRHHLAATARERRSALLIFQSRYSRRGCAREPTQPCHSNPFLLSNSALVCYALKPRCPQKSMEANCQHKKFLATITASQSRGRADVRAAGATLQWFGTPEKCAEWVDPIANLVLLSRRKNSEANNYDFETKRTKYFQSAKTGVANFALTTQVLD